jgi:hypothetical protein
LQEKVNFASSPRFELQDVIQKLGKEIEHIGLNTWQLRTLSAIKKCRTSALGGHIDGCDSCGHIQISYNSCRNRHCPKCQGQNREAWIVARESELLPVPYFHVVFTLPECLNGLALAFPREIYKILFDASWQTLKTFGNKKGVKMGAISLLHSWGQNLSLHPHLHCIVPGGGVTKNNEWQNIRSDGKFLFSVKALSKVFRAKYCEMLKNALPKQYQKIQRQLWEKPWVIYAKRPFGTSKTVIEYLGRYSHKIAISNRRIVSIDDKNVTFYYKDYKEKGQKKLMTLTHKEFIRRFAMHILPKRFVKIRHYGILSSSWKKEKLKKLQSKMNIPVKPQQENKAKFKSCPCCKEGTMNTFLIFGKRGPPKEYMGARQKPIPHNQ